MGLIEDAKEAVKLVQKINNIELYHKILDLEAEALELMEKLREKDEKIAQLEEAISIKGNLKFEHSAYWKTDENDKIIDGPFCTKCWEIDHKLCRLINGVALHSGSGASWQCIQCPKCQIPFISRDLGEYINQH